MRLSLDWINGAAWKSGKGDPRAWNQQYEVFKLHGWRRNTLTDKV